MTTGKQEANEEKRVNDLKREEEAKVEEEMDEAAGAKILTWMSPSHKGANITETNDARPRTSLLECTKEREMQRVASQNRPHLGANRLERIKREQMAAICSVTGNEDIKREETDHVRAFEKELVCDKGSKKKLTDIESSGGIIEPVAESSSNPRSTRCGSGPFTSLESDAETTMTMIPTRRRLPHPWTVQFQ